MITPRSAKEAFRLSTLPARRRWRFAHLQSEERAVSSMLCGTAKASVAYFMTPLTARNCDRKLEIKWSNRNGGRDMHKLIGLSLTAALAVIGFSVAITPARAATTYSFTTIDNPGDPTFNQLLGINNEDVIAGYFGNGAAGHPNEGYTFNPSTNTFTPENFPGAVQTQVTGINNKGTSVGFYAPTNLGVGSDANYGFSNHKPGVFTAVQNPATGTTLPTNQLLGINDNGIAVGFYVDGAGVTHGYTFNNKTDKFSVNIDDPKGVSTTAAAINNAGDIAGFFTNANGVTHGFYDADGIFTTLTAPKSTFTEALGLNNVGQVVGASMGSRGKMFGFLYTVSTKTFNFFKDPNGVGITSFNGINDAGDIVGFYVDAAGNTHGLLATPNSTLFVASLATSAPEPTTWVMMLAGFAGLGFFGAWRQRDPRKRAQQVASRVGQWPERSASLCV
jgi:hypothetical protein